MNKIRRRAAFLAASFQRRVVDRVHPHVQRLEQRLAPHPAPPAPQEVVGSLAELWNAEPTQFPRGASSLPETHLPPVDITFDRQQVRKVVTASVEKIHGSGTPLEEPGAPGVHHYARQELPLAGGVVLGKFQEVRARAQKDAEEKIEGFRGHVESVREDAVRELMLSGTSLLRRLLHVAEGGEEDSPEGRKKVRVDLEKALKALTSWLHPDTRARLESIAAGGS
jgi:hypothetical protein